MRPVAAHSVSLAFAILALWPVPAPAAGKEPRCATRINPKRLPEAQALTDRGKQAYTAGRYEEAIQLFEQAHCVLPAPLFRYNVSSTYRKLNRCEPAIRYGRLWADEADAADRDEARKWVATLLNECSEVQVDSEPAGASLWIDDEKTDALGTTPWTGWVVAGNHRLLTRSPGYLDDRSDLIVPQGDHPPIRLRITLDSPPPLPAEAPASPAAAPVTAASVMATPAAPPVPASQPAAAMPAVHVGAGVDAQAALDSLPEGSVDAGMLHALRGQAAMQHGSYAKAAVELDAALAARPGDADVLQLQAQNLLKLVEYNKLVTGLELAEEASPDRADLEEELVRLYAASDQRARAAVAQYAADRAEALARENFRSTLRLTDVKTVAIAPAFARSAPLPTGATDDSYLGLLLPRAIAHDLATSPYLKVGASGSNPTGATYSVDGQYAISAGAELQITARLVDSGTRSVVRSSSRTGPVAQYSRLEHAVAADLLDQFVPLPDHERTQITEALPIAHLTSLPPMATAVELRAAGDAPGALRALRTALTADDGNVAALRELLEIKKELGGRGRVALQPFKVAGLTGARLAEEIRLAMGADLAKLSSVEVSLPVGDVDPLAAVRAPSDVLVAGTCEVTAGVATVRLRVRDEETQAIIFALQVTGADTSPGALGAELAERLARHLVPHLSDDDARRVRGAPDAAAVVSTSTPAQTPAPTQPPMPAPSSTPPVSPERTPASPPRPPLPEPSSGATPPASHPHLPDVFRMDGRWQGLTQGSVLPPLGLDLDLISGAVGAGPMQAHFSWVVGAISNHTAPMSVAGPGAVSLVDSGLDIDLDFLWGHYGFDLGAAATLGYVQTSKAVQFFYGVRPRAGVVFDVGPVQITAGLGWQFGPAPSGGSSSPTVDGLFTQVALQTALPEDVRLPTGFELGYREHLVMPEGSRAWQTYGSFFGQPGGLIPQQEFLFGKGAGQLTYSGLLGFSTEGANPGAKAVGRYLMIQAGFDLRVQFFPERHRVNPFAGFDTVLFDATGAGLGGCGAAALGCVGLIIGARFGVEINLIAGLNLEAAFGYDLQFSGLTVPESTLSFTSPGNFSGAGTDLGLLYRF